MEHETKMAGTEAEKLRDYLIQDLAASKIKLNENKKNTAKLLILSIILSLLVAICVLGFAATIYFITKEQTAQIQAIFSGDWDIKKGEADHIYQDGGDGGGHNSVITYNRNFNGNNNTATVHPK